MEDPKGDQQPISVMAVTATPPFSIASISSPSTPTTPSPLPAPSSIKAPSTTDMAVTNVPSSGKPPSSDSGRLREFGLGIRQAVRDFTNRTTAALTSYFTNNIMGHVHERKNETLETLETFAESQQGQAGPSKSKGEVRCPLWREKGFKL